MGKVNLLKAGYEKKVGTTYGVAKKGLYAVKAVPFSHAPHNAKQTTAKNEFIGLNRIASRVVKKMWNYLNLSDKEMYRNNALCQAWKGALKGDTFHLENLKDVISQEGALQINEARFDPETLNFAYEAVEVSPDDQSSNQNIYLAIVTNRQITKADVVGQGNRLLLSSVFDYVDFAYFQVWAFKSVLDGKKWRIKGLSISEPKFVVIVNGVFYVSRWHWEGAVYVLDKTLYLPPGQSYISNGTLFLV